MIRRTASILAFLLSVTYAAGLDGRMVILVVSEHRTGDPKMKVLEDELRRMRKELGYTKDEMPLVFMGFADSDTEKEYFDRLGFQSFDSPILCVAEWGNPARFGPKRVVDYAIARSATRQHVAPIIKAFLETEGLVRKDPFPLPPPTSNPLPPITTPHPPVGDAPGQLELLNVRFEASGKPLYMTNVGVRIRNADARTLRNITVRFYCKTNATGDWFLMDTKQIDKIPAGHFVSRDVVNDTRKFNLVDENQSAMRCRYRIEVEHAGQTLVEEGEFVPAESPVGMRENR